MLLYFDRILLYALQKSENLREKPSLKKVIPKMSALHEKLDSNFIDLAKF